MKKWSLPTIPNLAEGNRLFLGVGWVLMGCTLGVAGEMGDRSPLDAAHSLWLAGQSAEARQAYRRLAAEAENPGASSLAQLALADTFRREREYSSARREYERLLAMSEVPRHHREEAQERLGEIERALAGLPAVDPRIGRTPPPTSPDPGWVFHVEPEGSDENPGTAEKPFATLQRARDVIRERRAGSKLPLGGVAVWIGDGEYPVTQTLQLTSQDSGNADAPIIYRAARGAEPRFRGGVRLRDFERVTETNAPERLPDGVHEDVWVADLARVGVGELLPLRLGGFASGRGFRTHPAHELFFDGEALPLAAWPENDFIPIRDVAVKDGTKGYDREGSKVGQFFYEGNRPARWQSEPDLWLYGYWFWNWADSYEQVQSIDLERKLITLNPPYHNYGFSVGAPFKVVNALSELDQPGEWYLERETGRLFVYPPSSPRDANIEISAFPERMVDLQDVDHVRFLGLTWELGSADAIRIRNGEDCALIGCTVRQCAGNGIEIQGGRGHRLQSCEVESLGRAGVLLSGGDRKTLTASGHLIENCDIHDLSRIDHTYTPAILVEGVGHRILHNRLHDIRSSAMRVNGNDHRIEYNEIFHVVLESDDQGGADMWGNATYRGNVYRFNYWHDIGSPFGPLKAQPKLGQSGIRLDDAICGTLIYGNVFERCGTGKIGFGAVQIHGGKDNILDNNLFIEGVAAVSFTPWSKSRWDDFVKNALDHPSVDRALYLKKYPELHTLSGPPNVNRLWRNVVLSCGSFLRRDPGINELLSNVVREDGDWRTPLDDPGFALPGFAAIPFEAIGLYRDAWRTQVETP